MKESSIEELETENIELKRQVEQLKTRVQELEQALVQMRKERKEAFQSGLATACMSRF